MPKFLENIQEYKEKLRFIGIVNGLIAPSSRQYSNRISSNKNNNKNSAINNNTTTTHSAINNTTVTNNKNDLIIKDMLNDSDIVLEKNKTNHSTPPTTTFTTSKNLDDSKPQIISDSNASNNATIITTNATNPNTTPTINTSSPDTDSFNDSLLEDYNIMYNLNQKCESFDSEDIRNYISKEIAANTKNEPINKPLSSSINNNSSFCVLL